MPSLRKSQSARENGAKSHGPKTEAGKQRSSQNALRHGLSAQTLVLPSEDPAEYQRLLDGYLQQFRPTGPVEADLVHEMVAAKWRLNRLVLVETQLLAASTDEVEQNRAEKIEDGDEDEPLTPAQSLAQAFENLSRDTLSFLYRTQGRLERTYSRALRTLQQMQAQRGPSEPPVVPPPETENKNCTNEPTGSTQPNGICALPASTEPPEPRPPANHLAPPPAAPSEPRAANHLPSPAPALAPL